MASALPFSAIFAIAFRASIRETSSIAQQGIALARKKGLEAFRSQADPEGGEENAIISLLKIPGARVTSGRFRAWRDDRQHPGCAGIAANPACAERPIRDISGEPSRECIEIRTSPSSVAAIAASALDHREFVIRASVFAVQPRQDALLVERAHAWQADARLAALDVGNAYRALPELRALLVRPRR